MNTMSRVQNHRRMRQQMDSFLLLQLHGMFAAKLAVALMLAGGVTCISPDGMHIRGDIHVLMVGDPGTGT